MQSLQHFFRIGVGPSSSHTIGPTRAVTLFLRRCDTPPARLRIILMGSLASTGEGHGTDIALRAAAHPIPVDIVWQPDTIHPLHPNTMTFEALGEDGVCTMRWTVASVGGGALWDQGGALDHGNVYSLETLSDIMGWCHVQQMPLWRYVMMCEGLSFEQNLAEAWQAMQEAVMRGITTRGELPGPLRLRRRAPEYMERAADAPTALKRSGYLAAFALAVAEENAAGGIVVTAPTCGAAGVLAGVLFFYHHVEEVPDEQILHALATAGLIGNLIKTQASISGAEVGCQGEIGTACAMAAAAAAQILGGSIPHIEYAAEIGIEHHLGLTCDPVAGLVQIPCIERNAIAAIRAVEDAHFAVLSDGSHHIPFDDAVRIMKRTGHDLSSRYRETAEGGLAVLYHDSSRPPLC